MNCCGIDFTCKLPLMEFVCISRWSLPSHCTFHLKTPHTTSLVTSRNSSSSSTNSAYNSSRNRRNSKKSKPTKNSSDLRKEIMEFNSFAGLPLNHVPSMKQLSENGRTDLAHVVRRRGYKMIAQLLNGVGDTSIQLEADTRGDVSVNGFEEHIGQYDKSPALLEAVCDSSEIEREEELPFKLLHERAASFVNTGVLDVDDLTDDLARDVANSGQSNSQLNQLREATPSTPVGGDIQRGIKESNAWSALTRERFEPEDGGINQERFVELDNFNYSIENDVSADDSETQLQIENLKAMIHQKEMELAEMKQHIESEKVALAHLQKRAINEIDNAMRVISEKDAELTALEENLTRLKEVKVDYRVDAGTVEVAGSFNGWTHPIKMEHFVTSSGPLLWSATMWLYPGVYEMKFIVDGVWVVDPQRELTRSGSIENNLLRVDR